MVPPGSALRSGARGVGEVGGAELGERGDGRAGAVEAETHDVVGEAREIEAQPRGPAAQELSLIHI